MLTPRGDCSSSPASENAELLPRSEAPHTTLVAEVPVLDPQTTLNALSWLLFQGSALPQTTELPLILAPQTTEVPHTTDDPQTTDTGRIVEFPFVSETV